jgi:hypothetical protein
MLSNDEDTKIASKWAGCNRSSERVRIVGAVGFEL